MGLPPWPRPPLLPEGGEFWLFTIHFLLLQEGGVPLVGEVVGKIPYLIASTSSGVSGMYLPNRRAPVSVIR